MNAITLYFSELFKEKKVIYDLNRLFIKIVPALSMMYFLIKVIKSKSRTKEWEKPWRRSTKNNKNDLTVDDVLSRENY